MPQLTRKKGDDEIKPVSPWMTRTEAAEYLRYSVKSVDRRSVAFDDGQQTGKMRYKLIEGRVRIWAADVYALLPMPEQEAA
jgi:NADH dehydrogenase FAD-containing subunit